LAQRFEHRHADWLFRPPCSSRPRSKETSRRLFSLFKG
jgi:hypothetical protein